MKIRDLNNENFMDEILLCVAEKGFEKAVEEKLRWLENNVKYGLKAKIAYKNEKPVGFIEYVPVENSPRPVSGKDLMFINCIWVLEECRGGVGERLMMECI